MWINLTNILSEPLASGMDLGEVTKGTIILNARVQLDPELLESMTRTSIDEVSESFGIEPVIDDLQCFSPAYPDPPNLIRKTVDADGKS